MTIVFLHPIGLDGESWERVGSAMDPDAVRYTLQWHGDRPPPPDPLSMASFADDVAANVAGPFDVVGLSMGGAVAMELAVRHPERVRSLLVACITAGGDGGDALRERADAVDADGMAGVLESTLERWFTPAALADPHHPGVGYARQRLLADHADSFAASWRALAGNDVVHRLDRIRVPTTVVHAVEDASGPLASRQAIADGIPGARLVTVPGPHMVQLETPDAFDAAVVDHLEWARRIEGVRS